MKIGNPSPEQLVRNVQEYRQRMRDLERLTALGSLRVSIRPGHAFDCYVGLAEDDVTGHSKHVNGAIIDLLGKLGAV